jgi:hypothetical protein
MSWATNEERNFGHTHVHVSVGLFAVAPRLTVDIGMQMHVGVALYYNQLAVGTIASHPHRWVAL